VGSIVAWHKNIGLTALTLPDGWVECNGGTVSDTDSPIHGETIPDLNGGTRFLRGGATSGAFQADAFRSHSHTPNAGSWFWTLSPGGSTGGGGGTAIANLETATGTTGGGETRPINMSVVWIMRIR
jgi:hypothetical protein